MNLFLDTNVIIDMLEKREPFYHDTRILFRLCLESKLNFYVSSLSYTTIFYVLNKTISKKEVLNLLIKLNEFCTILAVDSSIIKKSISSDFNDFEDAVQYYSAKSYGKIEFIITRNKKDFIQSEIQVLTPKELLKNYA